jgi:hypothetical protein
LVYDQHLGLIPSVAVAELHRRWQRRF